MIVILITAGRNITDPIPIRRVLFEYVVVYSAENIIFRHGNAKGGDKISAAIMHEFGVQVQTRPVEYYGLNWKQGLHIGNVRNEKMLDEIPVPGIVLAFPDNLSKGTYNCADQAILRSILVKMYFDYLSINNPQRNKYRQHEG